MRRPLLPLSLALTACTPSPQEAPMPSPDPVPAPIGQTRGRSPGEETVREPATADEVVSDAIGRRAGSHEQAAVEPVPSPVADSPAAALGRRTLSTAFVRTGPDGRLTVELRDGRALVLRDVAMQARDYCGVQVLDGQPGRRFCGEYADVAAARPGGSLERTEASPVDGPAATEHGSPGRR